jgi:excisionase family DNA binding protein
LIGNPFDGNKNRQAGMPNGDINLEPIIYRMTIENNQLLNEDEAAEYLGISISTIKRKRYQGEIPHYRIGARIRYSVDKHLEGYLANCEVKSNGLPTETEH